MSKRHGQLRRSQVVSTWGPGALLDLPNYAVIVGGLDTWPAVSRLEEIHEPRLTAKLQLMTGVDSPRLYAPPAESNDPREKQQSIGVWQFPEWFIVQEAAATAERERSRRLVHRKSLDSKSRFDGQKVIPTRFVRACPRGHVDDLNWKGYVHGDKKCLRFQLWLDETGTTGDLADLRVRCECGATRRLNEATLLEANPLATCSGQRPWLGPAAREDCKLPSRLLIRSASNAYFAHVMSVLSLPDRGSDVQVAIAQLWDDLSNVDDAGDLKVFKKKPKIAGALAAFSDAEVLDAIRTRKKGGGDERPVKLVELEALLAVPEGFGDDVPVDPNFHARKLPRHVWNHSKRWDAIESVVQVHRLREVQSLIGFTRFEAIAPDINGEYDTDVERADLALEPKWFPAVENRGEGIFIQLHASALKAWLSRPSARAWLDHLAQGHQRLMSERGQKAQKPFPGGPYVLLHTVSHLLIQSLSMRSGYPASSIRERVYADPEAGRYGILLYTGSPDAEGTLGGLVQQARHVEHHLRDALAIASLCSNDPICAQHDPADPNEGRWLHGASCHGCTLIAETSCEMRNDYLDRSLVVPVVGRTDAAFFGVAE